MVPFLPERSDNVGNAVNVTANSTIDVTGTPSGTVGNISIGNNTLSVTGSGDTPGTGPYTLTATGLTLTGNAIISVANNGTGLGTLTVASITATATI